MNGVPHRPETSTKYSAVIESMLKTIWVYSYESEIKKLADLYEKAKVEQWNASSDVDWSIEVDLEKLLTSYLPPFLFQETWYELDDKKKFELATSEVSWLISQILHGEQGALLVASQLVSSAPLYDEKLTAATQVIDEARHVEVFHKYLTTKMNKEFPITPHLEVLMKNILSEPRWYFKFVGMQVLIEGLAMGIFGTLEKIGDVPLLVQIIRYVMKDEARHVAFGVISLKNHIDELPPSEKKELVEFSYEGCVHLRNRIVDHSMVWEDVGLPKQRMQETLESSPAFQLFIILMFARVITNLKKLGLLPDYIRPHYEKLGILKYEDVDVDAIDSALNQAISNLSSQDRK